MSTSHIILDYLLSFCQKFSKLVEVWWSSDKNNFAQLLLRHCLDIVEPFCLSEKSMRTSNLEENYLVGSKFEPTNTGNPFKSSAHSVKTPGHHTNASLCRTVNGTEWSIIVLIQPIMVFLYILYTGFSTGSFHCPGKDTSCHDKNTNWLPNTCWCIFSWINPICYYMVPILKTQCIGDQYNSNVSRLVTMLLELCMPASHIGYWHGINRSNC